MKKLVLCIACFLLLGADGAQFPPTVNFGSSSSRTSVIDGNLTFNLNTAFIGCTPLRTDTAGSDLAGATQIVARVVWDEHVTGTEGLKLPATPNVGDYYLISDASGGLRLYPGEAGDTIENTGGPGNYVSLAAMGSMLCYAISTSRWVCMEFNPP